MARRRWIQDRETGELREVSPGPYLPRGNVGEGFVSPVDGSIISTQIKLHDHNRRNNVEQTTDGHFQDWDTRMKERDKYFTGKHDKEDRIEAIRRAMGDEL